MMLSLTLVQAALMSALTSQPVAVAIEADQPGFQVRSAYLEVLDTRSRLPRHPYKLTSIS